MNPFTRNPAESVSSLGEVALLAKIRGWVDGVSPPSPWGIGDDCAVLDTSHAGPLLATTDGVVYGRHFDEAAAAEAVGAKLLNRNLSDIAAMGGRPAAALLNLLLPAETSLAWLEGFYRGLAQGCQKHGVSLVGGDLAQGPAGALAAHLTLLGVAGASILKRTGGGIGDFIYVTGDLGGSIAGKHLGFTPRLAEGQWLAGQPAVRSMIDVTDGLAKDLPELLPTGTDARLHIEAMPISPAATQLAEHDKKLPLYHALTDGEDYELLFTLDGKCDAAKFEERWRGALKTPLTRIGVIAAAHDSARPHQLRDTKTGALLLPVGAHGYEHWR